LRLYHLRRIGGGQRSDKPSRVGAAPANAMSAAERSVEASASMMWQHGKRNMLQ